jgi:hypothetical protein
LQPAKVRASEDPALDEPRTLEYFHVLRSGCEGHSERRAQLSDRPFTGRKCAQYRATCRIR